MTRHRARPRKIVGSGYSKIAAKRQNEIDKSISRMMYTSAVTFEQALKESERLSITDIDNRYCVCLKHGTYGVFTVAFAREHDYPVVVETIY